MCYTSVAGERGVFQDSLHSYILLHLYVILLNLKQKYSFLGHIRDCQNIFCTDNRKYIGILFYLYSYLFPPLQLVHYTALTCHFPFCFTA